MKDYDYSISDISKISGVGFKTTLNVVHKLEERGILKRTRQIGNAILYKLNSDSPQAKSISRLAFDIAKKRIRAQT
jgi:DNA-binding Lrp family transcriptional regulator